MKNILSYYVYKYYFIFGLIIFSSFAYSQESPYVRKIANGKYKLILTEFKQNAVNEFLLENLDLTLLLDDDYEANLDEDIEYYMSTGDMQFRYAAWGDFNEDFYEDIMLIFVEKNKLENPYHPEGYVYNFVIFEGKEDNTTSPRKVHSEKNGIIDGILYYKKINTIEFASFGVASGYIKWDGKGYKVIEMIGD